MSRFDLRCCIKNKPSDSTASALTLRAYRST